MKITNKQSVLVLASAADRVAVPALEAALGHRDPEVRIAAVNALRNRGEPGFYALLRAAAHGNRHQRQAAVTCLGDLRDVRALQPLLASLVNDRRERKSRTVGRFCLAAIVTCLNIQAAVPLWAETFRTDAELQICAARALGNLGDVRAVLPLIDLARESDFGARAAARSALLLLLPSVSELPADRVRSLGANAIAQIASLLSDHDEPLVRQALATLCAIGDRQAIPAVERLSGAIERPYLHQEARRVLVVLNDRAESEQLRTSLLRGSRLPSVPSEGQLLRPAAATRDPERAVGQLLRPVGDNDNP